MSRYAINVFWPDEDECYIATAPDLKGRSPFGESPGEALRQVLIAREGWLEVAGIGPVSPRVAKKIAQDAFLNGVFYDGVDLRHFARWSKHIPIEVLIALELGDPPAFDGVSCVDCGNRFRTEFDHIEPRAARGPSSNGNIDPRCYACHQAKTTRDRKAGKLKPQPAEP